MHSALYIGQVRHRRFSPRPHAFAYRMYMLYLDLDELDTVFRGRWLWSTRAPAFAWWRRADYLGDPGIPLQQAVRDLVEEQGAVRPTGPIRMLTHLRYCGYSFNPVTFYYCYDASGGRIETIVAEITNTPWNERHAYVLGARQNEGRGEIRRYRFGKAFHVSPFIGMNLDYDWRFNTPGDLLHVHMGALQEGNKVMDATLRLSRHQIEGSALSRILLAFPFMTLKVVAAIYWQALWLWLKGIPFIPHPGRHSPNHANRNGDTRAP